MVKWILIGVGAVVAIIAVIGVFGWITMNRPIDPNSASGQAYAESFKKSFVESCIAEAARSVGNPDATLQAKLESMCGCAGDATYEAYKDQPPVKLISLSSDPDAQQQITAIMQQCAHQAGLQ